MYNSYSDSARIIGSASTPSGAVIDDFEDGDVAEWTTVETGGSGSLSWSASSSDPISGGQSGLAEVDVGSLVYSTSGLPEYVSRGETFEVTVRSELLTNPGLMFGVESTNPESNHYIVYPKHAREGGANWLSFEKVVSGTTQVLDGMHFPIDEFANTEIKYVVDYGSPITVYLINTQNGNQIARLSQSDSDLSGTGVGFKINSRGGASQIRYDDIQKGLSVPSETPSFDYPVTQGLEVWYKMQDGSGSTLTDTATGYTLAGNTANSGDINNPTWTTDSKTGGYALDFDGENDIVRTPDDSTLDITNDISIAYWTKYRGSNANNNWQGLVNKGGDSGPYGIWWTGGTDTWKFEIDGSGYDSGYAPSQNTWEHHVWTIDYYYGTIKLYVNGSEQASFSGATISNTDASDLILGKRKSGGDYYNGLIDDFRLYNRQLASHEAQKIYSHTM